MAASKRRQAMRPDASAATLTRSIRPLGAAALLSTALAGCALFSSAPETPAIQPLLRMHSPVHPPMHDPAAVSAPALPTAWQAYEFGKQALSAGQHELAEAWFEQALHVDPGHVDAINGRFVAAARRGHAERALALGEQAQRRGLASPELVHNMRWLREHLAAAPAVAPGAPGARTAGDGAFEVLAHPSAHLRWQARGPQLLELISNSAERPALAQAASLERETPVAPARFEISNASGVAGLARRQSQALRASGLDVQRITNHERFDLPASEVRFRGAAYRAAAQSAAALLPGAATLVHDAGVAARRVDVRILLGRDGATAIAAR
jgi:hypothetical protein